MRLLVMDVYHKWFLISQEFVFSSDLPFKESRLGFSYSFKSVALTLSGFDMLS